jgi:hypothetical protein
MVNWCTPKLFDGLNYEFKGENIKKKRNWGTLFGSQHFMGRGEVWGKFVAFINNFPAICDMPPTHKEIKAILDF